MPQICRCHIVGELPGPLEQQIVFNAANVLAATESTHAARAGIDVVRRWGDGYSVQDDGSRGESEVLVPAAIHASGMQRRRAALPLSFHALAGSTVPPNWQNEPPGDGWAHAVSPRTEEDPRRTAKSVENDVLP